MITVYTTSHCPQCQLLKQRLNQLGIEYEVFDDEEKMQEMGITSVPVMSINGTMMRFRDALDYLNERQIENGTC